MDKFKEIIKKAKAVSLTKNEKAYLRAHLQAVIRGKNVMEEMAARQIVSQRSFLSTLIKPMPILASLALVAFLGGGVSFAAENSLPGDTLYPIKLYLNEEVRAALTTSLEAKGEWEARRAERRLEEVEKLAVEGRLEAKQQMRIEENFERHAEKVQARIAKLEAESSVGAAAELSSRLETSLEAHSRILQRLSVKNRTAQAVAVKAKAHAERALKARLNAEAKIAEKVQPVEVGPTVSAGVKVSAEADTEVAASRQNEWRKSAAEGRLRSAELKIEEVKKFLAGAEISLEAEAKLALAEKVFVEGKVKLESNLYGEAFLLFQQAHRLAQEAKLLVRAHTELKVEVHLNGDIDDNDIKVETNERIDVKL